MERIGDRTWQHRGYLIDKTFPSGYYWALGQYHPRLLADTLEGMRQLIRDDIRLAEGNNR